MKKRITLLIVFFLSAYVLSFGQGRDVTGTVKEKDGSPLPGVSVKLKNSKIGASTGADGRYSISVSGNAVLIFSAVGFTTQEVAVNNRNQINITLVEESQGLSEVVVIGYGTAQKKDVTGAISSVKAVQLENENPQSVADILKGNIAGLSVSMNTSAKGGGNLLVRGKTTLSAGTAPLIVLDGVIYNGQLSDINPNDIESVDVLKDASSLAVFGAKAATGVVAITTKKGKGDTPTINLNSNFGIATLSQGMDVYDGPGFINWRGDVMRSGAATAPYLYNDPRNLPEGVTMTQWLNGQTGDPVDLWLNRLGMVANEKKNYLDGKTTNWYDEIFRTGLRQDHTLSMSGKKEEISYYMSLGYQKNENVIKGAEFNTFRSRVNLEGQAAKFLTVGLNLQFAARDEGSIAADWTQLTNLSPYGDMYNADGTLRRIPTDDNGLNARNPFLNMTYNDRLDKQNTLFANLFARAKLPFGITYQINFSPGLDSYRTFNYSSSRNPNVTTPGGIVTRANETRYNWQIDNLLKWNKSIGVHSFDVTLLANAEKYQTWWTEAGNQGLIPDDLLGFHNVASGIKATVNSEDKVYTGDALMARLNYSLMQKYNLTLSVRRDGYSVFGINSKRATFPAAAFAWNFTEESFLESVKWLNYGKLRVSYGINGNRDLRNPDNGTVDPYAALSQLNIGKYQTVNSSGAASEVNTVVINTRLSNPDLKWEETTSLNVGLDFGVLDSRISGSVDVYDKKTTDLLVRPALTTATGYVNYYSNLAEVNNKGLEISLNSRNITEGNVTWNTSFNFSLNRNKIVRLTTSANEPANGWFIGKDIDVIWDYKILGVWQESEMAEANKFTKGAIKAGDFKLEDVDGNYLYDDADKQYLGYKTPRFMWAMRNEFNLFKKFDFSFQLVSNWGQQRQYNQAKNQPGSVGFARMSSYIQPYWTPQNPINDFSRLNSGTSGTSFNVFRKSSFVRLNTIALAYSLPQSILSKVRIKNAKVYVNANNAAVFTDWKYWDPQNDPDDGPTPTFYTLGLNISL
jgi:TonB-linked SusC/RagA family outer membrane protein